MQIGSLENDNLLAGNNPALATDSGTILQNEGTLGVVPRGAVLGKVTAGTPSGEPDQYNTGNATIGSITRGPKVKPGVYQVDVIEAGAYGTLLNVKDPDGFSLGDAVPGTAFESLQINFTVTEGNTPLEVGDSFTITVPAGSGKLRWLNGANVDGSAQPYAVLAEKQTVASNADKAGAPIYKQGHFNRGALTFKGQDDTVAKHENALRDLGILVSTNHPAEGA